MPVSGGVWVKNCSKASNPPAEAPMPTMGKGALVSRTGTSFSDFGDPGSGLFLADALGFPSWHSCASLYSSIPHIRVPFQCSSPKAHPSEETRPKTTSIL